MKSMRSAGADDEAADAAGSSLLLLLLRLHSCSAVSPSASHTAITLHKYFFKTAWRKR